MKCNIVVVATCMALGAAFAEDLSVSFAKGQWSPDEWLFVRSPRWQVMSHWLQKDDCIANYVPDDIRPEDIQMGRDRTGETYVSMLYKKPFHGNAVFHTHCAFDGRMAPLIVFSRELSDVHHDHLEVVLYDSWSQIPPPKGGGLMARSKRYIVYL